MWVATPEAQTKWLLVFASQVPAKSHCAPRMQERFYPWPPGASLTCWALSLLCPQVYLLSLVVQVPHLHSHLSGTSSAVLIPCRLFSTYQEPLPGTPTAYLVQSNLYSILYSLIVTVPPFLTLLHVNRSLMIPPQLLPFRSGLPSSGSSPIHPSAFPTLLSAALTQRLGITFEDFVIEINKEL